MAQAYNSLLAAAAPASRPDIVEAQSAWLTQRDNACADEKSRKLAACLIAQSDRRRAFLAGEPEAGPGAPGRLEPWLHFEKGGKGKAAVSMQLLKYPAPATPAERAFNAAIEKLAGGRDEPEKDDPGADHYEYDRDIRLIFASPTLISAFLSGFNDTGGAHPNVFTGSVNIDVEKGRELVFDDLLDAHGAKTIFGFCVKEIVAEKKKRMGADAPLKPADVADLAQNVATVTGNLGAWTFATEHAAVTYDPYAVGAYAEGAYECDIPYATLKPLAKAGFPLP
jgi:hypothetical protein